MNPSYPVNALLESINSLISKQIGEAVTQFLFFVLLRATMKADPVEKECISCLICPNKSILFSALNEEELAFLNCHKKQLIVKKGGVIVCEGETVSRLIYLKQGLLKLYKQEKSSSEQILGITKPFDFVGFLSVFSNEQHPFSIAAIEDSTVCTIDIDCIRQLIRQNGNFALKVIESMSKISDQLLVTHFELNSKNLRGRIAYILLYLSESIYKKTEFELPISRKEVAELINMTTENVIRILSEFRKDNVIDIDGKTIRILHPELLRKISESG